MNHQDHTSMMHFKSAQIAGMEIGPTDMAQINQYALSPLAPEDVFAFKVSMAANEVDRDYEMFPRTTLSKLASLFIGKTVVKDHDHRSDNQIARIYATDLVDGHHMQRTKSGEIYSELIAKCYMIKTSTNADLIAEIRAGIRKEVSLGCRIGKAVCSICDTDNVKTYCTHFGGKQYEGETCFFRLEEPTDAYELSFVAIPAQQHAGTVKAYGAKPCRSEDAEKSVEEERQENLHTREKDAEPSQEEGSSAAAAGFFSENDHYVVKLLESIQEMLEKALNRSNDGPESPEYAGNDAEMTAEIQLESQERAESQPAPVEEEADQSNRLTINRFALEEETCTQDETSGDADSEGLDVSVENGDRENFHTRDPEKEEGSQRVSGEPATPEEGTCTQGEVSVGEEETPNRLIINQSNESADNAEPEELIHAEDKAKEAEVRIRALGLSLALHKHINRMGES